MNSKVKTLAMTLMIPAMAHGKDVKISIENLSYPSPATVHLDHVQNELAAKAIKACGGLASVDSLSDIKIRLQNGIGKLASISKKEFGLGLNLNYPKISASAIVTCVE